MWPHPLHTNAAANSGDLVVGGSYDTYIGVSLFFVKSRVGYTYTTLLLVGVRDVGVGGCRWWCCCCQRWVYWCCVVRCLHCVSRRLLYASYPSMAILLSVNLRDVCVFLTFIPKSSPYIFRTEVHVDTWYSSTLYDIPVPFMQVYGTWYTVVPGVHIYI